MKTLLDRFPSVRVAVIGDLMLDSYLYGEVSRISPEAPVPVMRATSEKAVAGGAANVAANLAALGLTVRVVGLCGEDEARDQLVACLTAMGPVDCTRIVTTPDRRTTRKLRIIGAQQQIVRIDHEDMRPHDAAIEDACIGAALGAIDAADLVILSDYGKGVCSDRLLAAVFEHAGRAGKRVLVDPKRRDLVGYRGASILTPNRKELADATQLPCETDEEAAVAAAAAQAVCGADILLTRSEKGMSFFPVNGTPIHLATVAQDVFDVSGAGDTVLAVLAAAVGARVPFIDAMRMANHAAGIVVSKMGTATVTRDELLASLSAEHSSPAINDGRHIDVATAAALRESWAAERLTVGLTNGVFDLLRPGHVALIQRATLSCDRLLVALNSNESARRLRGPLRPVQDENARAAVIGAIKGVSAVVLFAEDTPIDLIRVLHPDVLIEGVQHAEDEVVGAEIVKARGGRVVLVDLPAAASTATRAAADARDGASREPLPVPVALSREPEVAARHREPVRHAAAPDARSGADDFAGELR